ncbi:M16 family metallopeptidase [Schleiferia thermophila]|jgi:predicted Zn-dependent peptidase|uniref:M16 family metallopeptidase n=1 Tax=Schleiferia thermophila TaxID=884107 RepID=UPI0004E78B69|nr:pitrilysin family protein [Schleiferia thermophila]KFD40052.1 zinc protease [Schleiferia thermophila str. Yellowstone]PMB36100.1 insulinase family protein [Fischerella thermalis CCMEE 5319]
MLIPIVKSQKQEFETHTLPNGFTILIRYHDSPVVHTGLHIRAGTRDELPHEQGIAHFTEHMLFKGTSKHSARYLLTRLDEKGGELNAFTTRENTVLHATIFKKYYREAIEHLLEIALDSTFPEKEIRKEAEVIHDEILSYRDSPSDALLDEFDELLTGGHPIGRNILGTPESIASFTQENFIRFTRQFYRPDNMILFFSGKVKPERILSLAESALRYKTFAPSTCSRAQSPVHHHFNLKKKKPNHQCHAAFGILAPGVHHPHFPALSLLNHLLGGPGLNNLLNLNIREKYGLTYELESFYHPYSDCGFLGIYFGTDKSSLDKVIKLVQKELFKLIDTPLSERKLMKARIQFMGHFLIQQENALSRIINAARSYELFKKTESAAQIWDKLIEITPLSIQQVAAEYLHPQKLSSLIFESE